MKFEKKYTNDAILMELCLDYLGIFDSKDYLSRIKQDPFFALKEAEKIETHLKENYDLDLFPEVNITLALVNLLPPIDDYLSAVKYCKNALSRDTLTDQATIIFAFVQSYCDGEIESENYKRLVQLKTDSYDIASAKFFFLAEYNHERNFDLCIKQLEQSLKYCSTNISSLKFVEIHEIKVLFPFLEGLIESKQGKYDPNKNAFLPLERLSFDYFLKSRVLGFVASTSPS
jgi:hypothetical protein